MEMAKGTIGKRFILPLVLGVGLVGCVDFAGQTLSYRYDSTTDQLRVFQLYQGIGVAGSPDQEEVEQLRSVVCGERTFFFDNWISEYHRQDISVMLAELHKADSETGEGGTALHSLRIRMAERALESVKVRNGAFFLDTAGRLSAYQYVTVDKVTSFVELVNGWISAEFAVEQFDEFGEADRDGIRVNDWWLRLEGNELRIRWPQPYEKFKSERGVIHELSVSGNDFIVNYHEPLVETVIGRRDAEHVQLMHLPGLPKVNGLLEHVRKTYGIEPTVDIHGLRDAFLESGQLPPDSGRAPVIGCGGEAKDAVPQDQ